MTNESTSEKNLKNFSNYFVLKVNESDLNEATDLLAAHGFKLIRKIGNLNGYYLAKSEHNSLKRDSEFVNLTQLIESAERNVSAHPLIESFKQDVIVHREKRDFITKNNAILTKSKVKKSPILPRLNMFNDEMWKNMWYLNRHMSDPKLADMNVTGAWAQGFTGRDISITFLDDGLEWNNTDIFNNFDKEASFDLNDNDEDPTPRYDPTNENKHGTRCAGEVAAVANNSFCAVGVAYNSKIGGIRMLDGEVTDAIEAIALNFNSDHISIYSASWGPTDNGQIVEGPGPLTSFAFQQGVLLGRKGLGSIYVWASGNGGKFGDSCSCDGFINSIFTMAISSTNEKNQKPWYLEECAANFAATYSSGTEANGDHEIFTTDLHNTCTTKHTGTSASAPIAAAIIALALEANPNLSWRDVMFLTVLTSRPKVVEPDSFIMNRRGLLVSSRYGFGLMDAGRMVEMAKTWRTVPPFQSCSVINSGFNNKTFKTKNTIISVIKTNSCFGTINEVNFIEQVQVIVTIKAKRRGSLEIVLTSPMGTESKILPKREKDESEDGFTDWAFTTVQLWGEFPRGEWKLVVSSTESSPIELLKFDLEIHGTKAEPCDYTKLIKLKNL